MMQHQCTAALVLAKRIPHCSLLLCKTASQHALCHCNDGSRFAVHTDVQRPSTNALQHCSRAIRCALLGYSTKGHHSMHCVIAITPLEICCSYRCAVTQHQCTAALLKAKCIALCKELLGKTGSQQACVAAIAPLDVCFSHRFIVTQPQCTAALPRTKCIIYGQGLLCKAG